MVQIVEGRFVGGLCEGAEWPGRSAGWRWRGQCQEHVGFPDSTVLRGYAGPAPPGWRDSTCRWPGARARRIRAEGAVCSGSSRVLQIAEPTGLTNDPATANRAQRRGEQREHGGGAASVADQM